MMNEKKERVLKFDGVHNFRDVGGYEGAEGKHVRWGLLFRSGNYAKASERDQQKLLDLGITKVIDFRSGMEKEQAPNRLPAELQDAVVEIPILDAGNKKLMEEMKIKVEKRDFSMMDFDHTEFMQDTYETLVTEFAGSFKTYLEAVLANEGKPLVWHCTAGKDRTGISGAMLLKVLGVDDATVYEDYMLSRKYADKRWLIVLLLFLRSGLKGARQMRGMSLVERSWLERAEATIVKGWGDFETYRKEMLGLTDADVALLRAWYLE
jgi:protein-tyrosine phosphatase